MQNTSKGWIYVMSNPFVEGVKVGCTAYSPEKRAVELQTTGVPAPFKVEYAAWINQYEAVEKKLHSVLERRNLRISGNREFFNTDVQTVVSALLFFATPIFQEPEKYWRDDFYLREAERDAAESCLLNQDKVLLDWKIRQLSKIWRHFIASRDEYIIKSTASSLSEAFRHKESRLKEAFNNAIASFLPLPEETQQTPFFWEAAPQYADLFYQSLNDSERRIWDKGSALILLRSPEGFIPQSQLRWYPEVYQNCLENFYKDMAVALTQ